MLPEQRVLIGVVSMPIGFLRSLDGVKIEYDIEALCGAPLDSAIEARAKPASRYWNGAAS